MFTWICPTCGREVPPSYDECPDCSAKARSGEAGTGESAPAQPPAAQPPAAQPFAQPPQPVAPPPAMSPQPPVPAPARGLPVWLMSILFALAFIGLGAGIYWSVQYFRNRKAVAAPVSMETPAGKEKARPHPLQKYIEVTGIRFLQDAKKQTQVRFLVVNHSPDDISELGGNVTIWGRTQKSDEEPVGTFSFKLSSLGAWEYKDFSAPMNTRLRVYELPDWQNVTAEVVLMAP